MPRPTCFCQRILESSKRTRTPKTTSPGGSADISTPIAPNRPLPETGADPLARLRSKTAELLASLFFAIVATGMISLFYNLHPARNLPILVPLAMALAIAGYYLLENQRKNMVKFRKHPTTFPNPLGGGLIGEYMKRPWREELAQLAQVYNRRKRKQRASKEDRDQ